MRTPRGVDHLVYAVPDLEAGCDLVERMLGVRPAPGGHHPTFGTHNALLGLGPTTYLEVIAKDPAREPGERGAPFGLEGLDEPRLATWALRSETIERAAAAAAAGGVGPVEAGSRRAADGRLLEWRLTDPSAMPFDGAVPFLIAWGETPHPAATVVRGGGLVAFRIEHPDAAGLRRALDALRVDVDVTGAERVRLIATIRCAGGDVELS